MILLSALTGQPSFHYRFADTDHVRHLRLTVQPCDSKVTSTTDVVLTEKAPLCAADRDQFTRLVVSTPNVGKSTITIKKGHHGWPIDLKMVGNAEGSDALTSMLFLIRQPLWSPRDAASDWTATIYSPFESPKSIPISCHLSHPIKNKTAIRLEQKSPLIDIGPGMKAQFISTLDFDAVHGKERTFQIKINVNLGQKNGQLLRVDERD